VQVFGAVQVQVTMTELVVGVIVIWVTAPRLCPLTTTLLIGQEADYGEMETVVEDYPAGMTTVPIPPLARQESCKF